VEEVGALKNMFGELLSTKIQFLSVILFQFTAVPIGSVSCSSPTSQFCCDLLSLFYCFFFTFVLTSFTITEIISSTVTLHNKGKLAGILKVDSRSIFHVTVFHSYCSFSSTDSHVCKWNTISIVFLFH